MVGAIHFIYLLESFDVTSYTGFEAVSQCHNLVNVVVIVDCQFAEVQQLFWLLFGKEEVCAACHHAIVQWHMRQIR